MFVDLLAKSAKVGNIEKLNADWARAIAVTLELETEEDRWVS